MDLTTAIIAMSKAAESRRVARKQLIEATELVAKKIVEEGRAGDAVTVGGRTYKIEALSYSCSQWSNVDHTATGKDNTLIVSGVGEFALLDSRSGQWDGNNMHRPTGCFYRGSMRYEDDAQLIPWATPAIRQAFAAHAADVITAFAKLYQAQAKPMAEGAASISKLAIA